MSHDFFGSWRISDEEMLEMLDELDRIEYNRGRRKNLKCECGSEKVYGEDATHSDWCPKYE